MTRLTRIAALLCLLFLPLSACAAGTGISSDRYIFNSLAVYGDDIYCLNGRKIWIGVLNDYYYIHRISDGEAEEVYSGFGIDNIYSHSDGILIERYTMTLSRFMSAMSSGNVHAEVWNPISGSVEEWGYHEETPKLHWQTFSDGSNIYTRITKEPEKYGSERKHFLEKYVAPGESQRIAEEGNDGGAYQTFHLISIEENLFFKNKIKLTLYDFSTEELYSTNSYLTLPRKNSTPQAVMQDEKLYYLSDDALCIYDFATDSEEAFIPYFDSEITYDSFILSDEYILFLDKATNTIDLFDFSTQEQLTRFTASVIPDQSLLHNNKLYLYGHTNEQRIREGGVTFVSHGALAVECIDLNNGAQTLISPKS